MTTAIRRKKSAAHAQMILSALRKAGAPRSAYEIIADLRPQTTLAPQTVYRALEMLIGEGQVHKVESLNAFVACSHRDEQHEDAAFAICDRCGSVTEFDAPEIATSLARWSRKSGFALDAQTVELHGVCLACRDDGVIRSTAGR